MVFRSPRQCEQRIVQPLQRHDALGDEPVANFLWQQFANRADNKCGHAGRLVCGNKSIQCRHPFINLVGDNGWMVINQHGCIVLTFHSRREAALHRSPVSPNRGVVIERVRHSDVVWKLCRQVRHLRI